MTPSLPIDRGHLRFGLWTLAAWLCMGLALEGLHGFKVGWYLDVTNEARRHLLTLAHAHGTLVAILNLVMAFAFPSLPDAQRRLPSRLLLAGSIALPAGFLLGGLFPQGADPGLGIALVPMGAVALIVATVLSARAA